MSAEMPLPNIDRTMLTPVVRRALQREDAEVVEWEVKPLYGGLGFAVGAAVLYRIAGVARSPEGDLPWSLVLKILRSPSGEIVHFNHPDPGHPTYWKREFFVYGSGLLDRLTKGLAAPRCYCIDDQGDSVWLWLEELFDEIGALWPLSEFGIAARHIARFNGSYLTTRYLPAEPWLSNGIIRVRGEGFTSFWHDFEQWRDHPRFQRVWPGEQGDRIYRIWQSRDLILDALDRLPQVLCHADFDRRNLFARRTPEGEPETVVVDWAFLGRGAIGEDIAALVMTSVLWNTGPIPNDLPALSEICVQGYLAGLRDVGWDGDERLVRRGYTSAVALRFGAFAGYINAISIDDESRRAHVEKAFGASMDELLERFAAVQPFVLNLGDEALSLITAGSESAPS